MTSIMRSMAAAVMATALSFAAAAQDAPVHLKFAHWVPASHPMHPALQAWLASIEKQSNGTITSTIYPAQQLGKAFDHYNMARDGIADLAHTNPGYEPGRFPIVGAAEIPFIFADAKGGAGAFDAWYRKYAGREMKDVHYCLGFLHDPATIHSVNRKVLVPGDMKGLKVRPANATIARLVVSLGGTNVQASAPEARDILEKGVADAITFPWGSTVLFGIDKVVKYHIDAQIYATEQVWVMNKAKYESLSPAQKKTIDDHCTTDWAIKISTPWADFEDSGRGKIKALSGHEIYPLTAEQLAAWRKAADPLWDAWAEGVRGVGLDPATVRSELKAALSRFNAAY
jgi:TRAP-type transport system periplasmic protein